MSPRKKRKLPEELTTTEAINELFHPRMVDALQEAVADEKDEEISTDDDTSE